MASGVVTQENFNRALTGDDREQFWSRVQRTLQDVFDVGHADAAAALERYRRALDEAPIGEQMLAYHDDPLNIAAELAGCPTIDPVHERRYRDLQ
jgi:hypothetical protein